jgi:monoamine oxidase
MHSYNSKSDKNIDTAVVVGGGLTGLIAARNLAARQVRVVLFEASSRLGGRIYDVKADENGESHIPLGASRFSSDVHSKLCRELSRYSLTFHSNVEQNVFIQHFELGVMPFQEFKDLLTKNITYQKVLETVNQHAMNFYEMYCGSSNFLHVEHESMDISMKEYVYNVLFLEGYIAEYILLQVMLLFGSNVDEISTTSLFQLISWFDYDVRNVFAYNEKSDQLSGGLQELIDRIAAECSSLGVEINLSSPVVSISALPTIEEHIIVKDSFPFTSQFSERASPVVVSVMSGRSIEARSVIVTVPMYCLHSIVFTPPLPNPLLAAIQRCNSSRNYMKQYARAQKISGRINKVLFLASSTLKPLNIWESSVMNRSKDGNEALVSIVGDRTTILSSSIDCYKYAHPDASIESSRDFIHHDFTSDPWLRTAMFNLRPGTRSNYIDACKCAEAPWGRENRGLFIANADFSGDYWPGWLEGAVHMGEKAANTVLSYVVHPPILKNYARKVKNS